MVSEPWRLLLVNALLCVVIPVWAYGVNMTCPDDVQVFIYVQYPETDRLQYACEKLSLLMEDFALRLFHVW